MMPKPSSTTQTGRIEFSVPRTSSVRALGIMGNGLQPDDMQDGGTSPALTKRGGNRMTTFSIVFRTLTIFAATTLALGLLMLALGKDPAGATFPGTNGKIAFSTRTETGEARISTVNPDGSGLTDLTDLAGSRAFASGPVWSPDGTRLAFWSLRDENVDIFVMHADGSGLRRLTTDQAADVDPSWSPDGTKIAFVSARPGNAEIYTMNADGSGVRRLTNNPARDASPDWSPDGARIAFDTERDGNSEIYVVAPNGTGLTNLTNYPEDDIYPSWSPDGTRIAFSGFESGNAFAGIYTMNANGSEQIRLTNPATGSDYRPAWSPDGTKIAFDSLRDDDPTVDDEATLYVMNPDGTGQTILTNVPGLEQNPGWQPNPRCTIVGTPGNDRLPGTAGKDVICGIGGHDTLIGAGGNDILVGAGGDDTLIGGPANDQLNGGSGVDAASYPGTTPVKADLTTGFATVGAASADALTSIEDLSGSSAGDTLVGSTPTGNVLKGLGGEDVLKVRDGRGDDTADGGMGSDICQRDAGDTARSCP